MRNRDFVLIFFCAFLVRLINLLTIDNLESFSFIEDSQMYWDIGLCINDVGDFCRVTHEGIRPETERVPLYPLFLAAHLHSFALALPSVLLSQAILDSMNAVLVALLGSRFGSKVGICVGFIYTISHNFILHSSLILPETFTLFLFLLFVLLTLNVRTFTIHSSFGWVVFGCAMGVLGGLLILSKIVLQFMVLATMAFGVFSISKNSHRLLYLITFCLGMAMCLAPLLERNINRFGAYSLSSQSGTHALFWVLGNCISLNEGSSFSSVSKPLKKSFYDDLSSKGIEPAEVSPFELSSLKFNYAANEAIDLDVDVIFKCWVFGAAKNLVAPSYLLDQRIRKYNLGSFYESSGDGLFEKVRRFLFDNHWVYTSGFVIGSIGSSIWVSLAFVGVFMTPRKLRMDVFFFVSVIGLFLLVSGPVGGAKYRIFFEPFLTILGVVGALNIYSSLKKYRLS